MRDPVGFETELVLYGRIEQRHRAGDRRVITESALELPGLACAPLVTDPRRHLGAVARSLEARQREIVGGRAVGLEIGEGLVGIAAELVPRRIIRVPAVVDVLTDLDPVLAVA